MTTSARRDDFEVPGDDLLRLSHSCPEPVTARSPLARGRISRFARRLPTTSALTCVDVPRPGGSESQFGAYAVQQDDYDFRRDAKSPYSRHQRTDVVTGARTRHRLDVAGEPAHSLACWKPTASAPVRVRLAGDGDIARHRPAQLVTGRPKVVTAVSTRGIGAERIACQAPPPPPMTTSAGR